MSSQDDSEERLTPWYLDNPSGKSTNIRRRLAAAQDDKGLTDKDVAERMSQRLGKPVSHHSVGKYKKDKRDPETGETIHPIRAERQPPVDVMAAWARAVGYRLFVDLVPFGEDQTFALLHRDVADVAMELDAADPKTRALVLAAARSMLGMRDPEK